MRDNFIPNAHALVSGFGEPENVEGAAKPEHFFSLATKKIRARAEPSSRRGTNVSGSAKPYIFADIITARFFSCQAVLHKILKNLII